MNIWLSTGTFALDVFRETADPTSRRGRRGRGAERMGSGSEQSGKEAKGASTAIWGQPRMH